MNSGIEIDMLTGNFIARKILPQELIGETTALPGLLDSISID
jgi:hypothetical protein